jgi:hypothetical protein
VTIDYKADAELFKGRRHKPADKKGTFAELVIYFMTGMPNVPSGDRQTYTIKKGETIYNAQEIESIYNRPDFPRH